MEGGGEDLRMELMLNIRLNLELKSTDYLCSLFYIKNELMSTCIN